MKNLKRALRRHHRKRLFQKRKEYYVYDGEVFTKGIVDTPKPCSCFMCGNPRKYFNEKSVQEQRFEQIKFIT